jgi:creatinine amidohydrolase
MLSLAPDRVHVERAAAGDTSPLPEILPRIVSEGVRAVSANGVLGDPRNATASEGHSLLQRAVAELIALVDSWGQ